MRQKLCLFLTLFITLSAYAQTSGFSGNIIDDATGTPIPGVHVIMRDHNVYATSNVNGEFIIRKDGIDVAILDFIKDGYEDTAISLIANQGETRNIGTIKMRLDGNITSGDMLFVDESQINDEDGSNQTIGTLGNASDDVFLKAASFNFSAMRYSLRGYGQEYSSTYINGVNFNDSERGRFNYSMLGGLNSLFKNKDITLYSDAGMFSYGDLGGSTNIITRASGFAKGANVNIGATNRSYVLRGMVTAASGLMANGWAFNGGLIYRWSDEGAWDGTFYNSFGYYLGAEKVFNRNHSLSLITFGAPTERGQQGATTQEVYDLVGSIYYNPYWGYHNGKKRNSRVVNSYDPTVILSYEWKIDNKQKINVGVGSHYNKYSSTALTFYNAPDPRPDYYRNLPSFMNIGSLSPDSPIYEDKLNEYNTLSDAWRNGEASVTQIDWQSLYEANYRNNADNPTGSAKYALEERHNDLFETSFNVTYSGQVSEYLKHTAGIEAKYSRGMHYKTMSDLLGANQWIDIDQFSERDFPSNDNIIQNDLNNPNRVIGVGDKFGYNYDMHINKVTAFYQSEWKTRNFEAFYALKGTYYGFQREGKMRNGRAEYFNEVSYGKGKKAEFIDPSVKAGFSYKPDGHNKFYINAVAETRAPLANNSYISPRIKDTQIEGLVSEKILSYDANYEFNYRRVKGRISAFQTYFKDGSELNGYYDDTYQTFINQSLTGIDKKFQGIEAAATIKINGSFSTTIAGSWGDYRYTNNARGVMSSENGSLEEEAGSLQSLEETVYTKGRYANSGPQIATSLALNYKHSKMWFAEIKVSYFDKNYLDFAPSRLTQSSVNKYVSAVNSVYNNATISNEEKLSLFDDIRSLYTQEKLNNGFLVDASLGKIIYLNNRSQSLNINLSCNNILNNKKMVTGGFQQGRLPLSDGAIDTNNINKFPSKYYYAQGFNLFLNLGYRF